MSENSNASSASNWREFHIWKAKAESCEKLSYDQCVISSKRELNDNDIALLESLTSVVNT